MKKTYFLIMLILFTVAFISFLVSAEYVEEYGKQYPYYHTKLVEEVNYDAEFVAAYRYAYDKGITSASSIGNANMDWSITRLEMAKMVSQFALKVLWLKADNSKYCRFWDVDPEVDKQYRYWVTRACQLWLMWYDNNWDKADYFNPKNTVTRWQLATVLSRMLNQANWKTIENWDPYYDTHLKYLISKKIINDYSKPDPNSKEKRWNVMLMLYRADESNYVDVDYREWETKIPAWKIYRNSYYWIKLTSASITDMIISIWDSEIQDMQWNTLSTWTYMYTYVFIPEEIDDYYVYKEYWNLDDLKDCAKRQNESWLLLFLQSSEILKEWTEEYEYLFEFYWDKSYVTDYTNKKWYYFYQEPWCCIQESPYVSKTKDSDEYTSCPGCWPMGYFYNYSITDL